MESVDDVCGGGVRSTLASELARVQTKLRELEANMDQDLPPAAREICGELACRVDRSLRIARSWLPGPDSPESADGSPRGDGGQDTAGTRKDAQFKRRKGMHSVRKQVRLTSMKDTAALDDGFSWRKYGQKDILGAKYPRSYFRCTHRHTQSCLATKQVQRTDGDPLVFDVVYHGVHTCVQAAHAIAEQLQPGNAGQKQSSLLSIETGGLQAGFEPMTPLPFASTPAGTDVGGGYPLLSPTFLDWQLRSNHAAAGFGAGGMELEHQFEEFFSNPPDSFQWDFQDLYAAN